MYGRRKRKLYIIIALVVVVASLSIGFAAFSATLNISSSASVSPSSDTFSVKFSTSRSSLVVDEFAPTSNPYNLNVTKGIINNSTNPTITNLSATFTSPGQVVTYRLYARNEGEYTAYLNNVNYIGEKICTAGEGTSESLAQSACADINIYTIINNNLYTDTTPISGHALSKGDSDEILIVLEYKGSSYVDGSLSIIFPDVSLVYSTIDDSSMLPTISNNPLRVVSGDLDTVGSEICIGNGEECFYLISSNEEKVTLFAKYNLYAGYILEGSTMVDNEEKLILTPIETKGGINSSARGGIFDDNLDYVFPWIGGMNFKSGIEEFSGNLAEDISVVYNYYLTELGANVLNTRLITKEELESLGCSRASESCLSAPSWVYDTSYWTQSFENDNESELWSVLSVGYFSLINEYGMGALGARPVVEIARSEFKED